MKAAFIEQAGPPENITYGELPQPAPHGSEVLVKVGAVSVNPIDTYLRAGMVKMELPTPYIPGADLAGTVEAIGPQATAFKPGDRVWCSNQGFFGRQGTFAEYACVDERWLYRTPDGVDDRAAAAIALVGITAHLGLFHFAKLREGETVFVHGGSGGVGACVVQMAKAAGARVMTTAGSDEKRDVCLALGADAVALYKSEDVEAAIRAFAPNGIGVWFETLREQDFETAVPLMALGGRIVVMAGRDARPVLPIGAFYPRNLSLLGFAMFNSPPEEQRAAADEINRWLADGRLQANIDRVLPLSETAEAHRLQEGSTVGGSGALHGKIVLEA